MYQIVTNLNKGGGGKKSSKKSYELYVTPYSIQLIFPQVNVGNSGEICSVSDKLTKS